MAGNRPTSPEYVTRARIVKNRLGTTCLDFRSPAPQSHPPKAAPTLVRMLGDIYPDLSAIKSEAMDDQEQTGRGAEVEATGMARRRPDLHHRNAYMTPQPPNMHARSPSPVSTRPFYAYTPRSSPSLSSSASIASTVHNQADTPHLDTNLQRGASVIPSRAGIPTVTFRRSQGTPGIRPTDVRVTTPAAVPFVAATSVASAVSTSTSPCRTQSSTQAEILATSPPGPSPREVIPRSASHHEVYCSSVAPATETSVPSALTLDDADPLTYKREFKLCQLTEDEKAAIRNRRGKTLLAERAFTAWFESTADLPLACPPDLSTHDEIQLGDLYWHESPRGVQLWLWTEDDDDQPVWKPVRLGLSRESDGRRLFLNPSGKPSWMTNNWYHKQKVVPRNVFILKNE